MKTLLKLTIALSFIFVATSLSAQDKKITPGIKVGMNASDFTGDLDLNTKIGFNVGFTLDYAFTPDVYLLTGLEFSSKGAKRKVGSNSVTMDAMYINLPIHIGYKLSIVDDVKIVFRGGPYLAYGIAGKAKVEIDGEKESVDIFSTGGLTEFDFGLGLGTSLELGQIGINLGYDLGIMNVSDEDDVKVKNGNFYVGLGYKF